MAIRLELTDTPTAPEIFVEGLGDVENVGGNCWRFTFFATQTHKHVVRVKLVMSLDAMIDAMQMAALETDTCLCRPDIARN